MDDLRADAPLADEQPALHQVLDRAAGRRPGDAEPLGQVHLVFDPGADTDLARLDQLLEAAGDLEVQGNRARAVDHDGSDRRWPATTCHGHLPSGLFTSQIVLTKY